MCGIHGSVASFFGKHQQLHKLHVDLCCCLEKSAAEFYISCKKLQEKRSIAKLKLLHGFYHGYKFVTPSLLPLKAQNASLRFKPILSCVKVYDGSFFPSTASLRNKLPSHIVNTVSVEQFSDYVSDLDLQHFP